MNPDFAALHPGYGSSPRDPAMFSEGMSAKKTPRDVFAYVIHEGKVRAPAGAMELIERVK